MFHADACLCGCRQFVCLQDVSSHAAAHGSAGSSCFPALTASLSVKAIGATAVLLSRPRRGHGPGVPPAKEEADALEILNLFLNVVTPGRDSLRARSRELPSGMWRFDEFLIPGQEEVIFRRSFFTEEAARRTLGLALRELGSSWESWKKRGGGEPFVVPVPEHALETLAGLSARSEPHRLSKPGLSPGLFSELEIRIDPDRVELPASNVHELDWLLRPFSKAGGGQFENEG
jgi:hypothetical protein